MLVSVTASEAGSARHSHHPRPALHTLRSVMKTTADTAGDLMAGKADNLEESKHEVSLVSIVSDYLAGQHALCKNPMTTCPEFDLFLPHKVIENAKNYFIMIDHFYF